MSKQYRELCERVWEANLLLPKYGLVQFTWGNVSELDRNEGVFAIKPSGVAYCELTPEKMVVMTLDGKQVAGNLNPSSDMRTHLALYRAFDTVNGIVHTHSRFAVAWAQAGRDIPCCGTTHADTFYGAIPCVRHLIQAEIDEDYERKTGDSIVETFVQRNINPMHTPGAICASHGPFAWGVDAQEAVYHAAVLEESAHMAFLSELIGGKRVEAPQRYIEKHFQRKHGSNAYYGQSIRRQEE